MSDKKNIFQKEGIASVIASRQKKPEQNLLLLLITTRSHALRRVGT